jgi:hypothetical protein
MLPKVLGKEQVRAGREVFRPQSVDHTCVSNRGLLWRIRPQTPFIVAGIIGMLGTFLFAATVEEKYASHAKL